LYGSLLTLAVCWGAAFVAASVRIGAFALVPSLLVAGPIAAAVRLRQDASLTSVHGTCPRCGREGEFETGSCWTGDQAANCPGCNNQLHLIADSLARAG
jgi:hypothetical protein